MEELGRATARRCRASTVPARIAVRMPDEMAREVFGATMAVTLEVEG